MKRRENILVRLFKNRAARMAVLGVVLGALLAIVPIKPQASAAEGSLYSGTIGTCVWEVDASGKLTIAPADGVSGALPDLKPTGGHYRWPWNKFASEEIAASITSVEIMDNVSATKNIDYIFCGLENCISIDANKLDVSSLEGLYFTFANCYSLERVHIADWDTSEFTHMMEVFSFCRSLTDVDIMEWDVSNCWSLFSMFKNCEALKELDLSKWDVSSVSDMTQTFSDCDSLEKLDVSNWDVSNVLAFKNTFAGCDSLKVVDLRSWDTSSDANMKAMFNSISDNFLNKCYVSAKWDNGVDYEGNFYTCNMFFVDKDGSNATFRYLPKTHSNKPWEVEYVKIYHNGDVIDVDLTEHPNSYTVEDYNDDTLAEIKFRKAPNYYKVYFHDTYKTASGAFEMQTVKEGDSAVDPYADASRIPNKIGRRFLGWDTDFTNVQSELHVKALWKWNEYTVKFDPNGGQVYPGSEDKVADRRLRYTFTEEEGEPADQWTGDEESFHAPAAAVKRDKYIFKGWSTDPHATEPEFKEGDVIKNLTPVDNDVVTLYAVWEAKNYKLLFNTSVGSVYSQEIWAGEEVSLLPIRYTWTGYKFKGWTTSSDSTDVKLLDQQTVTLEDLEEFPFSEYYGAPGQYWLYAVWEPITYSIRFEPNGGSGEAVQWDNLIYGERYTLPAPDTIGIGAPEGMRFDSWKTLDTGALYGAYYSAGSMVWDIAKVEGAVIVMEAQWEPDTYDVSFYSYQDRGGFLYNDEGYTEGMYGIPYNTPITLSPNGFVRDNGDVFVGWDPYYPGMNVVYTDQETIPNGLAQKPTEYVSLYAVWAEGYVVHFDPNGGKGEMEDQVLPRGYERPLNKNEFTNDYGVEFLGWSTDPNATTPEFTDEQIVKDLTEDGSITLYAVWKDTRFKIVAARAVFGNNLDLQFAINPNSVSDWTGYYVRMERTYPDGRKNQVTIVPFEEWTTSGGYYVVTYAGFAAKDMTDEITVTVHRADGTQVSQPWLDSISAYARRCFDKASTSEEERRMIMDMVNYGTEFQLLKNYHTDKLANAEFTAEEQQKYATHGDVSVSSTHNRGDKFIAGSLVTVSSIKYRMLFEGLDPDTMYAKVRLVNHRGAWVEETITGDKFGTAEGNYYITVESMRVADARSTIYVTIYNADGSVYTKCEDSIEDYLARNIEKNPAETAAMQAFIKFSDSAYAYLHRND